MKIEQIVCDQCGARQGKGIDGWWALFITDTFHLAKPSGLRAVDQIDICSAMCATKKLQEFICPERKTVQERVVETAQNGFIQCNRCNGRGLIEFDYFNQLEA